MTLMDIGRVCYKIAGRESGKLAVIVDKEKKFLIIDGNVRRKKCNPTHLEPIDLVLKIKKGASTKEVHKAMKAEKLEVKPLKEKKKESKPRPRKQRKVKQKPEKPKKVKKPKKETKKKETKK